MRQVRGLLSIEGDAIYAMDSGLKDRVHIFRGMDASEMALVEGLLESRDYGPNETIYKE